jgi:hypothetical protein
MHRTLNACRKAMRVRFSPGPFYHCQGATMGSCKRLLTARGRKPYAGSSPALAVNDLMVLLISKKVSLTYLGVETRSGTMMS